MPKFFGVLIVFFYSGFVLAWGLRGHDTICQAATFLTEPAALRAFLKLRAPQMGHLCNIPDIHWKSAGPEAAEYGMPTHYVDTEILGLPVDQIPLDFQQIITDFEDKSFKDKKIKSIPKEFGSNWWRADQFVRRAIQSGKVATSSPLPKDRKEEQNKDLEFNKSIHEMINSMGVLGHFVGDNGQPFHSTVDHDGYGSGHGGIHAFYEHEIVAEFDEKLLSQVVARALILKKTWKLKGNVLERMRELSKVSLLEIKKILEIDKVKKASIFSNEKGMEIKKPAERELNAKIVAQYRPLIIEQMARSVVLLSLFWNEIYRQAGEPLLASYKSYQYPLQPDFVVPDYFKIEKK